MNEYRMLNQWEVIKRFDSYIGSANTKAGIMLSFSAATFAVLLSYIPKIYGLNSHPLYQTLVGLSALGTIAGLAFATWHAFHTIFPNTTPGADQSLIAFPLVAKFNGGSEAYMKAVAAQTEDKILEDLSYQSVILAQITDEKFRMLKSTEKWLKIAIISGLILLALMCAAELLSSRP